MRKHLGGLERMGRNFLGVEGGAGWRAGSKVEGWKRRYI